MTLDQIEFIVGGIGQNCQTRKDAGALRRRGYRELSAIAALAERVGRSDFVEIAGAGDAGGVIEFGLAGRAADANRGQRRAVRARTQTPVDFVSRKWRSPVIRL